MSFEQYLLLVSHSDRRYEFYDGEVRLIAGGSSNHTTIALNFGVALDQVLGNDAPEYDPITRPAFGQFTAQTLKNSYFFLFPGMGHGEEYNSDCANSIISAFEDNPTQKPSGTCINSLAEPAFQ